MYYNTEITLKCIQKITIFSAQIVGTHAEGRLFRNNSSMFNNRKTTQNRVFFKPAYHFKNQKMKIVKFKMSLAMYSRRPPINFGKVNHTLSQVEYRVVTTFKLGRYDCKCPWPVVVRIDRNSQSIRISRITNVRRHKRLELGPGCNSNVKQIKQQSNLILFKRKYQKSLKSWINAFIVLQESMSSNSSTDKSNTNVRNFAFPISWHSVVKFI